MANGEGMWTFDARLAPAAVSVGKQDGRLYIIVVPAGANSGQGVQMILKRMVPEAPPEKALAPRPTAATARLSGH